MRAVGSCRSNTGVPGHECRQHKLGPHGSNSTLRFGVCRWRLPSQPLGFAHAAVEGGCNKGERGWRQGVMQFERGAFLRRKNLAFKDRVKKFKWLDSRETAAQPKCTLDITETRHRWIR